MYHQRENSATKRQGFAQEAELQWCQKNNKGLVWMLGVHLPPTPAGPMNCIGKQLKTFTHKSIGKSNILYQTVGIKLKQN